jgi:DNA gyrase subunit B
MSEKYDASAIKVLEGLDAVRMRPGMYIGTTGVRGLHHMLWEIVDNAVDEALSGYADEITVTLHEDNSATVTDNGRGMPVDMHPKLKVPGVQVIYTQLHAGGKFESGAYNYSGGLHGVGASVVNALSQWVKVDIHLDGRIYRMEFESAYSQSKKKIEPGKPKGGLQELGKTFEKGSRVTFKPDPAVFEVTKFNRDTVERRLKEMAFLNKGLRIIFTDERLESSETEAFCRDFHYEGGVSDFVRYLNAEKTVLHDSPILLEGKINDMEIIISMQYTDSYTESVFSYVNNIPTSEGGMHETGFRAALTKVMNDYIKRNNLLKEKESALAGEDFREGLTAVISMKMHNVQFEGQTKTKLGNTEARQAVEALVSEKLPIYLNDLKHAETSEKIVEKALHAARVREATRKAKDLARKKSSLEGAPLVGKLSSCTGRRAEENELFIVEGDSAGGSAKQGRDRRFQAILPLRGKPLNCERTRLDKVLANEEYRSIITALGTSIDADFDITGLKYNKVIILSDADFDGAHIRAILLTFFFRYMKELITEGHLYIGQPPLYRIRKGKSTIYAYDDKKLAKVLDEVGRGYDLQRYKGLGEMNPEQLWETTMNPDNRKLIRVGVEDAAEADRMITILMGDKVEPRRDYISEHAYFNKTDDFAKLV